MTAGNFIGRPVRRLEDRRLLTGRGRFVDDVHVEGLAEMAVFRSPFAHAAVGSVDLSRVRRAPGVIDAFSATDLGGALPGIPIRLAPMPGFERFRQRPLAEARVRYVGEPVAVITAKNRYLAEDALALVDVEWERLPPVADAGAAALDESLLFEEAGTNVATAYTVGRGDIDAAFRAADYVRRESLAVQRQSPFPMETRGLIAEFDRRRPFLRVTGATKVNYFNRQWLADAFGLSPEAVELVEVDVGGGFGLRGELYPEDFLAPVASRRAGRPVKWVEDRREHLIAANHGRELDGVLEIAATADGDILGLRATLSTDLGAYVRTNGGVALTRSAQFLPGPYRMDAFSCEVRGIVTNKTPAGTYRGPGRFEANFFRERLIDMMAADLGQDPAEIRLRNLLRPDELPCALGELVPGEPAAVLDEGDYPSALQRLLDEAGYDGMKSRQGEAGPDGRRLGLGIACFVESSAGGPPETARISIAGDGSAELRVGASAMGQGLHTGMAQICADTLGAEISDISVRHGTTSLLPSGGGTFHSRNTVMAGNAVRDACETLRERCLDLAALRWNTDRGALEYADAAVRRIDTGETMPLAEIAAFAPDGLTADGAFDNRKTVSFSYGAHAALVAVDPDTGHVEVRRYVVVEEIGRALNPLMVDGQAVGGVGQGIGGALFDRLMFDAEGQPLATTLADYLLPTSTETGRIEAVALEDHPSQANPMGFKGAGEGGIVAVGAAIGNAIVHALRGSGAELTATPFEPVSLLRLLGAGPEGEGTR